MVFWKKKKKRPEQEIDEEQLKADILSRLLAEQTKLREELEEEYAKFAAKFEYEKTVLEDKVRYNEEHQVLKNRVDLLETISLRVEADHNSLTTTVENLVKERDKLDTEQRHLADKHDRLATESGNLDARHDHLAREVEGVREKQQDITRRLEAREMSEQAPQVGPEMVRVVEERVREVGREVQQVKALVTAIQQDVQQLDGQVQDVMSQLVDREQRDVAGLSELHVQLQGFSQQLLGMRRAGGLTKTVVHVSRQNDRN